VFNLGGNRPVALSKLIDEIAKRVGRRAKIVWENSDRADVPTTWANITKAQRVLGWSPKVSLEEGVRQTVEWFQEHRDELLSLESEDRDLGERDSRVGEATAWQELAAA
jgi:nucleoside-diphosphate-sugar epimerase